MKKAGIILILCIMCINLFAAPEWLIENVKAGKKGGTLFLTAISGPRTFNPAWSQETSSTEIIYQFLDKLIENDEKGVVARPQLAKSFTKKLNSAGGSEYTFTLRKGLKWSDGMPLTIDDVIFTFKDVFCVNALTANGNDTYKDDKGLLPEITKEDENTVKLVFKGKYRRGYQVYGQTFILPKHIFEKSIANADAIGKVWTVEQVNKLVSSGPFTVKEYKQGVRIVLERNENYYVKSADGVELPYLDKMIFTIVSDQNTERLKFEAGETDIIAPTAENFPALKALSVTKNWKAIVGPATYGSEFIQFNFLSQDKNKRELFRDVNFRKAVASSLNRNAIIDNILNGLGVPLYGPESPTSPYYNKAVDKFGENELKYSLTKAKEYLLKVKGSSYKNNIYYFNGKPVTFNLTTNTGNKRREEIGQLLVDSMKKLGIEANFRPMQFNAMLQLRDSGETDAYIGGLTGGNDPAGGVNVWSITGGLHAWNYSPEVKPWAKNRDYKIMDFEKRIDEIFVEQAGVLEQKNLDSLFDEYQMLAAKNQINVYTLALNYLVVHKNSIHLAMPVPNPTNGSGTALGSALWNSPIIWKD